MTHTGQTVLETLTEVGLAGSLIASQAFLDGTLTFRLAGDGPRPGLAMLLFAAIGVDVAVITTCEGLAVTVAGTPVPALSPLAEPVTMPYELWQRLDLSGIESRAVRMTLDQARLALEAGVFLRCASGCCANRQVEALANLARDLARQPGRYDHNGEAAALVALGLATGQTKHVEAAQRIYRREPWPAARYNEALCGYVLALRAKTRREALELLEGAGHILGREPTWIYYPGRGGGVEALKMDIDRAVGQAVPVVYVADRSTGR